MEEAENSEAEAPAAGPAADPAAIALGLGSASRAEADAYLRDQRAFIADQRHHLHEQFKQTTLSTFSLRLSITLKLLTALLGIVIVIGLCVAAWNASQADGMVVDEFSVPPGLAENGITGKVVADDLTAKIDAIGQIAQGRSLTSSVNAQKDNSEDVKVDIPETGVSLGQAWRYLRQWLGHERHFSGNLRLLGAGRIALTVTQDGQQTASVSGTSADLDGLEQQAAEQMFADADPINIVLYLGSRGRSAEGLAAAARAPQLLDNPGDRSDAYSLWSNATRIWTGDMPLAIARARLATDINPDLLVAHREMMWAFALMGHDEDALRQAQAMQPIQERDQPEALRGRAFAAVVREGDFWRDYALGAYSHAAGYMCPGQGCTPAAQALIQANAAAHAHDGKTSRALMQQAVALDAAFIDSGRLRFYLNIHNTRYELAANDGDWPAGVAAARAFAASIETNAAYGPGARANLTRILATPMLARALAMNGDGAAAQATIAATPGDCYDCVRTRGWIAAAAKQWGAADSWFADAVRQAPSIPFAYEDWGRSLLERGDAAGAIGKFTLASAKGPHFADPLEGWGEALMAQNRSDLALAKFKDAAQYAPNWGRLHLKWGEALTYAGKKDESRKQFALAATLDLTPAEKSELAKARG